jgi:Na+/H+ antiporter NhaC
MTASPKATAVAGAVFGDHCSPISDTTIMASTGADCDLVTHVGTQLTYAAVVASVSAVCFLIAGLFRSPWIPLAAGVVMIVAVLLAIRAAVGKNDATASE